MDSGRTDNERELTSTMGNVLSVSIKDEKNDTSGSDATPTSSTDANTTTTSSRIVSDDPISSTSSDVVDLNKPKTAETVTQSSVEVSQTGMEESDKASSVDAETDLLEMSISSVSRERITEDVEDLVHDLESLLGESTDSFNIPIKRRDQKPPVEKEIIKTSHMPAGKGDVLSLENSIAAIGKTYDIEEDITKGISDSSLQEERKPTTEGSSKESSTPNNTEADNRKTIIENISSCGDKESSVCALREPDFIAEHENVIGSLEEDRPDAVVNECQTIEKSRDAEVSKSLEEAECVAATEEVHSAKEEVENIVNIGQDVERNAVVEETEPQTEKVEAESIDEGTNKREEVGEDIITNDEPKSSGEAEVLEIAEETEAEPLNIISDSSLDHGIIQSDGLENTEDARAVCQTESISRDTKTENVESADDEQERAESPEPEELEEHVVDTTPADSLVDAALLEDSKNDALECVVDPDSPHENKEVEKVTPEECYETNVDDEGKLEEIITVPETSDHSQIEVLVESNAADIEEFIDADAYEEVDYTPEDAVLVTDASEEDILKLPTDNTEGIVEEPPEEINLSEDVELCSSTESKSQTNIPQSTEMKTEPEGIAIESVENFEDEELITPSIKSPSPVQPRDESNSDLIESELPKSPIENFTSITEESGDAVEPEGVGPTPESNQEEIIETEAVTVEFPKDDKVETENAEVESIAEQATVVEISEVVADEASDPPNDSSTEMNQIDLKGIELVTDADQENLQVEQMDAPPHDATNDKDIISTEIEALSENVDEEPEKEELQMEIASQSFDADEDVGNAVEKLTEDADKTSNEDRELTEDLIKISDEIPEEMVDAQEEMPLESVSEEILGPDDISEEVQAKNLDELSLTTTEIVEEINTEFEPIAETAESVDEIAEFSVETSKYIDSELSNEVIKRNDDSSLDNDDDDNSKPYNSQLEQDTITTLEEVPGEEEKQEQSFEWAEDEVPEENEAGSSTELIQDDIEDASNKIIETLDDDSKIVRGANIPFFSPAVDSDSEDTVPTLVLEPDEINPSPEPSHVEKETDQIDEPSIMVDSTNEPEIPDKLPEIEDILNDQGDVDDVVENIDMQENLETILAVASLQNAENTQDAEEVPAESQISDKERREMEVLRKAVESITEVSTAEYGDAEDITELIEKVDEPLQKVLPENKSVDAFVEELETKGELQIDRIEVIESEEVTVPEEKPVQSSTKANAEISVNTTELKDSIQTNENYLQHSNTEETLQVIPDTSEDKIDATGAVQEASAVLPDSSQCVSGNEEIKLTESFKEKESKAKVNERPKRHKKSIADNKLEELSINVDVPEREKPYSPKVTIKPIKVPDEEVSTTSNSDLEFGKGSLKMTITKQSDKMHSVLKICESDNSESIQEQDEPIPKLIIKPKMQQVEQQHSPKMSTRSSKQMYSPTSSTQRSGSPRITIKPVIKPEKVESVTPLKIKIKPDEVSKRHSPKLNIKPVVKPEEECRENIQSPRKVIIKPVVKVPEEMEQMQSPRITIKPLLKPESEKEAIAITTRLNIKPIKKQDEEDLEIERDRCSTKIIHKPFIKPQEPDIQTTEVDDAVKERIVLKINKGNLPTPTKESKKREHPPDDEKSEKLAKITVKLSKAGGHPHIVQQTEETNKRAHEEQSSQERVKKLKTENESPVLTRSKHKDVSLEHFMCDTSRMKQKELELHIVETRSKHTHPMCDTPIETKRMKLKDTPETSHCELGRSKQSIGGSPRSRTNNEIGDDVRIIESKLDSPIVISEDSRSQDSGSCVIVEDPKDPLGSVPIYEVSMKATPATPPVMLMKQDSASSTPAVPPAPTPRKRGRPRKVPIVVREDFKEQEEPKLEPPKKEEPQLVHESGRPKRSCRGQSARATLGIKPRKPRGPGRGRGSKRGMGNRVVAAAMKPEGEPKLSKAKLKLIHESLTVELLRTDEIIEKDKKICESLHVVNEDIKPPAPVLTQPLVEVPCSPSTLVLEPSPQGLLASPASLPGTSPKLASSLLTTEIADSTGVPPATPSTSRAESAEIVMVDEETRMSADTNSRAQTPAKQVAPADTVIEESQSSVQSTATTESGKAAASSRPNKAPRLEVQEPEGAVISADQLTEYYWNGNGPFMLQEQVAQFLGIKSFKRKYPGIMRRMLEMQERDFIRESGLASEHMCDLGLTAVNSADILDIMYSDFQDKYEEYCKHQRDRQAKELINKQKALSLAASQEKNKADITEQAVQSAAQWNATFNKARREQRKACMDLQTLTVHYPKGKMKQINKPKVGNYPVALVPGQFTDYYKEFTPTEINNLPLNTMCYNEINIAPPEESEESGSEGSDSDSDSSSSSSGSCSSSSGVEDCKLCKHTPKKGSSSK